MGGPSIRRALVVDDDDFVREAVCAALRGDFEVESLSDGARVAERCASGCFDVVVTDVRMPFDGVSAVRALRCTGLRVPVIFLTGNPGDVDASALAELSPAEVLAKPFVFSSLRDALRRLGL